ncbi:two-component system response regulator [Taibaiella sp. KBW10]|uniref:T9SS response regulator signal transducer PorX n=1 Tax=Taibaiella sp. KBW10 TaxID=2153357 RepID=UPI000F5A8954|nr:PglZ domain-containing protein [Taibaiella sp. KBW10]RQO30694.1 two-component system response regulator [Taibaiella sp. KBW10]
MTSNILWVDDEIESLKSQILFLKNKGYEVTPFTNGYDVLEHLRSNQAEVVILDESMPGMTGLETLSQIKSLYANLPVIMVTKNEAENIMEEAIGGQISDYLIKPVNPNQVLLSLKKIFDGKRLVSEKTTTEYQKDFRNLFMTLNSNPNLEEWKDLYKKLVYWELEMSKSDSPEMLEVFNTQKTEANTEFFKFVSRNYLDWINKTTKELPMLSHNLFADKIAPYLTKDKPTFMVLIDNLRFDQWKSIEPIINEQFRIEDEDMFFSILPTSTQYSRNAIFAGMMPLDIEKKFPKEWKNDDEEGGKNLHEKDFLRAQLQKLKLDHLKWDYLKITNNEDGKSMEDNFHNYLQNDLTVIVYNFVDMLSHARTEMEVLKELASDEVSYRSLTISWFEHSPLYRALKKISDKNIQLFITTDHGTTRVKSPSKVIGDRATTTNLRYKHGKNLQYEHKDVFDITNPKQAGLPQPNINSKFIFAKGDVFLCYPNNYNHFVNYYKNTFQHGGVSLEEVIVPIVRLSSK